MFTTTSQCWGAQKLPLVALQATSACGFDAVFHKVGGRERVSGWLLCDPALASSLKECCDFQAWAASICPQRIQGSLLPPPPATILQCYNPCVSNCRGNSWGKGSLISIVHQFHQYVLDLLFQETICRDAIFFHVSSRKFVIMLIFVYLLYFFQFRRNWVNYLSKWTRAAFLLVELLVSAPKVVVIRSCTNLDCELLTDRLFFPAFISWVFYWVNTVLTYFKWWLFFNFII